MSIGRACTPLALIYDRFVMACGGLISLQKKSTSTNACELFDSLNNRWVSMPKLNKERSATSACAFSTEGNFMVYVFPGHAQASWGSIESFDTKGGDVARMQKSAWVLHQVQEPTFTQSFSFGSLQVNSTEVLVFGGNNAKTYTLNC